MSKKHTILGIHITDRVERAGEVQTVLGAYGCHIRTRLGLHDVGEKSCSSNGLILIEVVGSEADSRAITAALRAVKGVQVQKMVFAHP